MKMLQGAQEGILYRVFRLSLVWQITAGDSR